MTKWALLFNVVRFAIAAALVAFVVTRSSTEQVIGAVLGADRLLVSGALLCLAVTLFCNAVRWRAIVARQGPELSVSVAVLGTLEGMFFNLFLPTSVGGDVARAYRAFDKGVPLGVAIQSGIIDRALGLLAVAVLLLIACAFSPTITALPWFWAVVAVAIAGLLAATVAILLGRALDQRRLPRWVAPLVELAKVLGDTIGTRQFILKLLPLTIVANLMNCLALWLCARATQNQVGALDAILALEASSLAALIPISIGGWGVREGATALIFGAVGNSSQSAVAAALVYGVVLIVVGLLGAVVWLFDPYRRSIAMKDAAVSADIAEDRKPQPHEGPSTGAIE